MGPLWGLKRHSDKWICSREREVTDRANFDVAVRTDVATAEVLNWTVRREVVVRMMVTGPWVAQYGPTGAGNRKSISVPSTLNQTVASIGRFITVLPA